MVGHLTWNFIPEGPPPALVDRRVDMRGSGDTWRGTNEKGNVH